MIFQLNGTEDIKITNKDNNFQDITINGLDYQEADGTIRKVNVILPNAKLNLEEKTLIAYANEIDKSSWALELEDAVYFSEKTND